ncbi:DUF952 domain-containing protein [Fibrella aquatilis]|uniref:DUF952 domain-containing protein n=1 Tax=Fibrella aquatilis TaxID=2817059 RepID=A0A939G9C1_9BACT|nr:DUF952 domain-containing protein [Fibrella aquatilis]MBO0933380.1 DUF952 domain-containing protein [Fibrella aquatilis]
MIYHITTRAAWQQQADQAEYEAESLHSEGFIHLSTTGQVAGVLERYYQGVPDLLLLHIDPNKLTHDLRYEAATNNEHFPHLYGALNKDAVVEVEAIRQ